MLARPIRFAAASLVFAGLLIPQGTSARAEDDRLIVHVLNRAGFGPRPGDIQRVREAGLDAYIDAQLHPERIDDSRLAARLEPLETVRLTTRELAERYFAPADAARRRMRQAAAADPPASGMAGNTRPAPSGAAAAARTVITNLQQQKVLRAIYSDRQLEEVMVDFWFNHFNVYAGKGPTRIYLTEYERDTIRPHVFGSFRELLGAVAESPAMLFYLDNWQSVSPAEPRAGRRGRMAPPAQAGARRRGINENYARELLELHTLGVDGGYTQKDVQEVARAFTGWTIAQPRQGGGFTFTPRLHDNGAKLVLGQRIPAGGGQRDGERVLDILAAHPSTARFIANKLARRFVADTPAASLVDRAAARFTATNGDIREVVRTILTSEEFRSPAAFRAKTKTPFELIVSAVRALDGEVASALPLVQSARQLGMPLYLCQPPTGYADRSEAWVSTGALLNRMNFALALSSGQMRGVRTAVSASKEQPRRMVPDTAAIITRLVDGVMAGDISESTRATVARATGAHQAAALVLGSPDFQKR